MRTLPDVVLHRIQWDLELEQELLPVWHQSCVAENSYTPIDLTSGMDPLNKFMNEDRLKQSLFDVLCTHLVSDEN
jgi:hypothetical protein